MNLQFSEILTLKSFIKNTTSFLSNYYNHSHQKNLYFTFFSSFSNFILCFVFIIQAMLEAEISSANVAQAGSASQVAEMERKIKLGEEALEASKAQQAQLEVILSNKGFFYSLIRKHH